MSAPDERADHGLRERIAEALAEALDSNEASASGYGNEFTHDEGGGIYKLDGYFDLGKLADAVIDELIDLAGTGQLLRGIAEYRRPHA